MKIAGFLERFADEKVRLDVRNVALQGGFLFIVLEKENFDLFFWIALSMVRFLLVGKFLLKSGKLPIEFHQKFSTCFFLS
jgi:hypothetical protein